jgi:hypothetical protein
MPISTPAMTPTTTPSGMPSQGVMPNFTNAMVIV